MNEISEHVIEYLNRTMKLPGESARSQSFAILLGQLFGNSPDFIEDYIKGIEQYVRVKRKDRILLMPAGTEKQHEESCL